MSASLPPKLYFRIGEVAGLVGVEPHVLRYWEREFRTIRPQKSAKGQRVYSRKDVENLLRVKDLLYSQGFTIAGARKKLKSAGEDDVEAAPASARPASLLASSTDASPASAPAASLAIALGGSAPPPDAPQRELIASSPASSVASPDRISGSGSVPPSSAPLSVRASEAEALVLAQGAALAAAPVGGARMREALSELRGEIEAFLDELNQGA